MSKRVDVPELYKNNIITIKDYTAFVFSKDTTTILRLIEEKELKQKLELLDD